MCRGSRTGSRALLFLFSLLSCLREHGIPAAEAALVNVTLDDTDPSFFYSPSSSWHASGASCSTCLEPDSSIASNHTWHDGTHVIPVADDDDFNSTTSTTATHSSTASATSSTPSASPSNGVDVTDPDAGPNDPDANDPDNSESKDKDSDSDSKDKDSDSKSKDTDSDSHRRRDVQPSNPFETTSGDSDDPGFVDTPVAMQLNFTGN